MKKQKIAICLSGAMSKLGQRFMTQESLYRDGEYVDSEICFYSIFKHIILSNPNYHFDFFIHSWNEDLKYKFISLYNPKKSLFEDNRLYNYEISKRTREPGDFAGISRSLSMKKCFQLLESYQEELGFQYDKIISYRPDLFLIKDINLSEYKDDTIYVNSFMDGQGDFHFIMNYNNLKQFKFLFDSLDVGNVHGQHSWIKRYINDFMRKEVIEDNIVAGVDQEVIRKICDGINPHISTDKFLEYKMNKDNNYTKMQRDFYNATADIMAIENHRGHDSNPDYYGLLLSDVVDKPKSWIGKKALEFGCGVGRNIDNLLQLTNWDSVDGCDISSENIARAEKFLLSTKNPKDKFNLITTSGTTIQPLSSNTYDYVMSTIVLQHIAVHEIRFSLLTDIYRVMKDGALFSFQMAQYDRSKINCAGYFDNTWNAQATNGAFDVSVNNPQDLIDDLTKIGFKNISYEIKPEWDANLKCYVASPNSSWIYIKAYK